MCTQIQKRSVNRLLTTLEEKWIHVFLCFYLLGQNVLFSRIIFGYEDILAFLQIHLQGI